MNAHLCFGCLKILSTSQICFGFSLEPICAVGHGVAALCCATNEDKSWVFQGYSLTGVGWAFTGLLLFGGFFGGVWACDFRCWHFWPYPRNSYKYKSSVWYPWFMCKTWRVVIGKGAQHWMHEGIVSLSCHVEAVFLPIVQYTLNWTNKMLEMTAAALQIHSWGLKNYFFWFHECLGVSFIFLQVPFHFKR